MANNIIRGLVIGLVIFVIGFLAMNYYVKRVKLSQTINEVKVLEKVIQQKDVAIRMMAEKLSAKQAELASINNVLENVKRELDGIKFEAAKKEVKVPKVEIKPVKR